MILGKLLAETLREAGIPEKAVQVIPTTEREAVNALISMEDEIDVIIPRGGEGLIRFVTLNSRIPVLKHYKGSATFMWTNPPLLIWPKISASTQRCRGPVSVTPLKRCWSTKISPQNSS